MLVVAIDHALRVTLLCSSHVKILTGGSCLHDICWGNGEMLPSICSCSL